MQGNGAVATTAGSIPQPPRNRQGQAVVNPRESTQKAGNGLVHLGADAPLSWRQAARLHALTELKLQALTGFEAAGNDRFKAGGTGRFNKTAGTDGFKAAGNDGFKLLALAGLSCRKSWV